MVVRVPKEENKHSPVRSPTPERLVNPPSGSVMSAIMTHVTDQANENEKERGDMGPPDVPSTVTRRWKKKKGGESVAPGVDVTESHCLCGVRNALPLLMYDFSQALGLSVL